MMGVTGSGKSTFIKTCTGKNVRVGHNLESCKSPRKTYHGLHLSISPGTTDVEDVWFMWDASTKVHLIDTPGFDDTNLSDVQVLQNIAHWLTLSFRNGVKLNGIIYLHRITDPRMTGSIRRNLLMFKKLCGENSYPSVILATTWWSKIDEATGSSHEQELINKHEWWGQMYKKGSKVFRHVGSHAGQDTGSRDSAMNLVSYILSLQKKVTLDIQDEIVNQNQDIEDTAAARELNADIIRERKKHQAELDAMRVEMAEAMAEHDEELRATLKEEYDELQAKIDNAAIEQEKLKNTLEEVHKRKEEEFRIFKAELEAQRETERQRFINEQRILEENFNRQQQELKIEQQQQLARMETATHEERERRDAEIRAKIDAQQRAHNEQVRQFQEESEARDQRYMEEINSRKNSKSRFLVGLIQITVNTQPTRFMDRAHMG